MVFSPTLSMLGHRYRVDSFQEYLEQNCPDVTLKKIIELPNDSFDSFRIASQELAANPDVNFVVYCGSAKAGLKAIQDCGRDIQTIFYDYAPSTKAALLEGKIDAAILQEPQEQGYRSIMALFDYMTSGKIPEPVIQIDNRVLIRNPWEASANQ